MNNKYVKTTKHNLKDDLLIKLRNDYIYLLSKDFNLFKQSLML